MAVPCALNLTLDLIVASLLTVPGPRPPAPDLSGTWEVVLQIEGFSVDYLLELAQTGDTVQGTLVSPRSKNRYPAREGTWKDSTLRIVIPKSVSGRGEVAFQVMARPAGASFDRLEGTIHGQGLEPGKFTATRKGPAPSSDRRAQGREASRRPSLVGTWQSVAQVSGEREVEARLDFVEKDGKLRGTATGERGMVELESIAMVDDGQNRTVNFRLHLRGDSGDKEYVVRAAFEGPDRLRGRWSAADGSVSGDWSARREVPPAALRERYHIVAGLPEGKTVELDFRPRFEGEKVGGFLVTAQGKKVEIRSGSYRGGRLELELRVSEEDKLREVRVSAVVDRRGGFQGTWASGDQRGELTGLPAEEL